MVLNSYSKSPARIKSQYQYLINQRTNELKQKKDALEDIEELIDNYQMDDILYISMGDSYVKVDSNTTEVYEKLIDKKRLLTDRITKINSDISIYKKYIEDLNYDSTMLGNSIDIQSMINGVYAKLNTVEDEFSALLDAYNESVLSEDNVVLYNTEYNSPSIISTAFIMRVLKFAGPMCLIAFLLFSVYMLFRGMKAQKKLRSVNQ